MMERPLYFAYGSNINLDQMRYEQNGLPVGCLKYAFKNCLKECGIEPYPKKVQTKPLQRKEASHER
mgnify:CR=1 FL=1